jgi:hypothetical protein
MVSGVKKEKCQILGVDMIALLMLIEFNVTQNQNNLASGYGGFHKRLLGLQKFVLQ